MSFRSPPDRLRSIRTAAESAFNVINNARFVQSDFVDFEPSVTFSPDGCVQNLRMALQYVFSTRRKILSAPIAKEHASVVGLSLLTAACLLGDSMLYVVLPIHWREAGLSSLWEVGVLLSVNRLARLPLNPLVGWTLGRIDVKTGMVFAAILAVLTTGGYAVCQGFGLWIVMRCLWGLSWTFLRLGGYFAVLEISSESNRGKLIGTFNGLYRLGSLAGMLLGGFLSDWLGLRATSAIFAVLTLAAIPVALRSLPRGKGWEARKTSSAALRSCLADGSFLLILLTGLLLALVYWGILTSTLSRLIEAHYGKSMDLFGIALGAASIGGALQALRWGWEPFVAPMVGRLSDGRFGRPPVLIAALAASSVLFALVPVRLPTVFWLALVLAVLLTATITGTVSDALACDAAYGSGRKMLMAAYTFAVDLGAAIGPLVAYSADEIWGPFAVYWIVAAVMLLSAWRWYARRDSASASAPGEKNGGRASGPVPR